MNSGFLTQLPGKTLTSSLRGSPFSGIRARISSFDGSAAAETPVAAAVDALDAGPGAGLPGREPLGVAGRDEAPPTPPRRSFSFLVALLASDISASLPAPAPPTPMGELGRDSVDPTSDVSAVVCFFFVFLTRDDSLPLASERLGEPGRLRMPLRRGSVVLDGLEGVPGVLVCLVVVVSG